MLNELKALLAPVRAWMAQNERAYRETKAGACCSAPAAVYAQRKEESRHA